MAVDLERVCEACGGKVYPCLKCNAMLHCIEVYSVAGEYPYCVLCASKRADALSTSKERMYA